MRKLFIFIIIFTAFFVLINKAVATAQNITINEIQLSPIEKRFIELYNPTDTEINLTNYYVQRKTQSGSDFTSLISKTYFENKIIGAHEYFLISRENLNGADIILGSLTLTASNTIQIKKSANEILDIISWGEIPENQSYQKMADNSWVSAEPTPKALNFVTQTSQTIQQTTSDQNNSQQSIISSSALNFQPSASNLIADAGENIVALIDQEIIFDASKSAGDIVNYEWNFGDGQTSKEKVAKHKYAFAGKYITTLTISDGQKQSQAQITTTIYPSGVYINEFLPSPAGSDENEWIEIYNSNNFIVDISGWRIDDEENKAKPFIIPQNTFISTKNYLVFPRNTTKIALNNDNDSIKFYYPEGIIIDEIKYEKAKEEYSASRKPNSAFVWTKNITPGTQNIFLSDTANTSGSAASNKSTVQKSENYFAKNLITSANAQTVIDDPIENGSPAQINTPTNNQSALENKNISANISNAINLKTIGKLFLIFTTLGIFALMWQIMKKDL